MSDNNEKTDTMLLNPVTKANGYVCGDDMAVWATGDLPRVSVIGQTSIWEKISNA
jgi:hypothetical protein